MHQLHPVKYSHSSYMISETAVFRAWESCGDKVAIAEMIRSYAPYERPGKNVHT